MGDGLTPDLAVAALSVGLVCLWIASRDLPFAAALGIVTLRVGLPLVYFAWFFEGGWTFLDDITYWNQGRTLLALGYDPITLLLRGDGLQALFLTTQSLHILYPWWNHLAQYLFGPHYYAAVFLNVGTTFVAGAFLARTARLAGFSERYTQWLLAFFLLHWDVVVWSSFPNLKDVLVMTLSVAAFYFLLRLTLEEGKVFGKIGPLAGLVLVLVALPWLRFYLPFFILAIFGVWVLLKTRGWRKWAVLAAAVVATLAAVPSYVPTEYLVLSPAGALYGAIRFALTPQPWSIQPEYSFLLLPSVLHWLLFAPSLLGAVLLWHQSRAVALLLLYFAGTTALYAVVPELQGPRHRVQVAFIWAWLQFHALYWLARQVALWNLLPGALPPELRTAGTGAAA